jgi:hypothetical protein
LKHKLFKNLSLSFISLILFITLAEIIARVFSAPAIGKPSQGIILEGTNRSFIHKGIMYKTNSLGLRSEEIPFGREENIFRLLVLGDSFIWGDGLNQDELISTKIAIQLDSKYSKTIEVINGGISGSNTKDEYNQLVRLFPYYEPDLVILFFFTNDVLATDTFNQITSWKVNLNDFLRENSAFYSFLYYSIKNFLSSNSGTPSLFLPSGYFNIDDSKPGWVDFKYYFIKIKEYCDDNNVKLVFVSIPTLTNLDSNYPYKELRSKVSKFITNTQTPFIDLFNLFSNYSASELWVNERNKHWNGIATSLTAVELSAFIIENELLRNE